MKKQFETEIQKLLDQDFIEPVNFSSEWVSPLVFVPKKNGNVPMCVDMRKTNTAIIRNYYPIPTLDEILYDVNGAKIFNKLDLAQGYHQIVLDEKARYITIFSTPQVLSRYKRLIFGTKNAFEDFEKIVETNNTHDMVCSTLVMILLLTQQLKMNICNSFEKFFTRYERKARNLT